MSRIAVSGAGGFLGWHVRVASREFSNELTAISLGDQFDASTAAAAVDGRDRVIHLAGVNRAPDDEIYEENLRLTHQLSLALKRAANPPAMLIYANSTQAGNGSAYGSAKQESAEVLAAVASEIGTEFLDVPLPNLFGEHGRPFYNSVTATFCHQLANGHAPTVKEDKQLRLLHAQDAADILVGNIPPSSQSHLVTVATVSGLLERLTDFDRTYRAGTIPDIADDFNRNLFNTYRSFVFSNRLCIPLVDRADSRGSFVEVVRAHGGSSQSSFSTTRPGVVRGNHFHRRKVERFTVVSGRATIRLRRVFTNETVSLDVDGASPVAVDMPTMWAHNIVNTGGDLLYTLFWTNDIFDPINPDTITEVV